MKFMLPFAPYRPVYLIVKLFRINFIFIRIEAYYISIGPSIDK